LPKIQSESLVETINRLVEFAMKHKDKVTDKKNFIVNLINIKIEAQMRDKGYTDQEITNMMKVYELE